MIVYIHGEGRCSLLVLVTAVALWVLWYSQWYTWGSEEQGYMACFHVYL